MNTETVINSNLKAEKLSFPEAAFDFSLELGLEA
jgi:hypothetical protein